MRILTISSLYPNAVQPHHGIFVENRLRHIQSLGGVEFRVVAPVPWFPSGSSIFGRYGVMARVAAQETRHGIVVDHPRYPVIPKIGMTLAPELMYRWLRPIVGRLLAEAPGFDLIDAHYFYPDGVAAAKLAREFRRPLVITARGVDINRIPDFRWPRRMILQAADQAAALITVSRSLKQAMVELGIDASKIEALRNGVDLEMFRPIDGRGFRDAWGLDAPLLISVGHLIPRKGHAQVIRALRDLPEASLAIIGTGPDEAMLRALVEQLGLGERVRFIGAVPHEELAQAFAAADVMVLASSSEGWANVLLESLACGTPVVATARGGTPEVITVPEAGRLIEGPDPEAIARAVRDVLAAVPDRGAVRRYAEGFGWQDTARRQRDLYRSVCPASGAR